MMPRWMEALEARKLLAATTLRIDVGGDGYVEPSGKTFAADRNFTGGTVAITGTDVAGTDSDEMFNTRRYGSFAYSLPIRSGSYRVKLYLMDPIHSIAGQRLFDVHAEKQLKLSNFDIAAAAGGANNTAVIKTFTTTVNDGRLNLWFTGKKDHAIVSAIEVTPLPAAGIAWKALPDAAATKFESMRGVADGKLYVFGGYTNTQLDASSQVAVFDPESGTWSTRRNMPEPLTHSGVAVDNAFIYFAGGYIGASQVQPAALTRHVWRYDTVTDDWQPMLSLPVARSAGALVRVGRRLHYFGGIDSRRRDRPEHWILDLRRPNKWVDAPAMPNPRNHLGAAEVGGKIYAVGGQHALDEHHGNEDAVHAYDVVAATWSSVASLPLVLSHNHNATFISGGKVTVAGGSTAGMISSPDVLQYDPPSNSWKKLGELPVALSAAAVDLLNGHIIVTGGRTSGGEPTRLTWINV